MRNFLIALCSLLALTCADTNSEYALPMDSNIQGRIYGGSAATAGQIPWHVWVRSAVGTSSVTCGGALISANWVLTAAHCVQGYTSFTVGAGSNTLSSPLIQMSPATFVVNPNFNASNYNNDLALLMLPTSLSNSTFVTPVRLPAVSQTNTTFANFSGTLSGFGRLNNSTTTLSPTLQVLNMNVMTNANCANVYGTGVVIDNAMCALGASNTTFGACLGDSGSGMVIYENNTPTLIGIVSFISARGCGAGDPTGFARVSRFLSWINAVTGIALRQ